MNGKLPPWLVPAFLSVVSILVVGLLALQLEGRNDTRARLDRIETRVQRIEEQYSRIAVVEAEIKEIRRQLTQLLEKQR